MPPAKTSKRPGSAAPEAPPGELALIERIRRRALPRPHSAGRELRLGIGDDCAILRPKPGEDLVVTTDFSLEGRHFRRDWHPPQAIGHRTLARGLSDLAAMGARPVAAFLSLALPKTVAADTLWLDSFLDGLFVLAERAGVPLAGGDTSESPNSAVLADIILLGAVPTGRALRRDGARPGDRLFVTGALGGAAAELRSLSAIHRTANVSRGKPGLAAARRLTEPGSTPTGSSLINPHPHLYPEPRLALGQALLRRSLATAAIDLSDGLSTDLRHLCNASGIAAEIDTARLPLHPLASTELSLESAPDPALDAALHGGEDYELLFAAPPRARLPAHLAGVRLTEIGRCLTPRRGQPTLSLRAPDGRRSTLATKGWEHLR